MMDEMAELRLAHQAKEQMRADEDEKLFQALDQFSEECWEYSHHPEEKMLLRDCPHSDCIVRFILES